MKKYQLPKELAEKWIIALESGKYKQGLKKLLNWYDEYCCLGVLGCILNTSKEKMKGYSSMFIGEVIKGLPEQLNRRYDIYCWESKTPIIKELVEMNDKEKILHRNSSMDKRKLRINIKS